MRITRFSATIDGGTTFSELDINLPRQFQDSEGHLIQSSKRYESPAVQFAVLPAGLNQSWHPAPQRQIVVVLSGTLEVTTTDLATRQFGPGQRFLADDVGSRGHLTRTIDGPVEVLFAPMPPAVDLASWLG